MSWLLSGAVHAGLLFGTTGAVMQPPRFEVEAGSGGVEVSLIAAPLPSATPARATPSTPSAPEPSAEDQAGAQDWGLTPAQTPDTESVSKLSEGGGTAPVETPPSKEAAVAAASSPLVGDGSAPVPGRDPTTLYLPGGAAGGGRGGRLKNPAPAYPYAAIRQRQEGVVTLLAVIDPAGRPLSVEIMTSSGFPLLDESALRTVRRWTFDPAHLGFLPVQSRIAIPIRFVLDDRLTDLSRSPEAP